MRNPLVDQAAQPFQKLHARITKMVAGGLAPHASHHWDRRAAEETSGTVCVGGAFFFHFKSPSSRPSEPYSPTLRGRAKAPPSRSAVQRAASGYRSVLPVRRPS